MPDYAKLYHRIFNSATDAITILQKAQQDTEEMFVSSPESEVIVLDLKKNKDEPPETE